jgi:hypothetical protein
VWKVAFGQLFLIALSDAVLNTRVVVQTWSGLTAATLLTFVYLPFLLLGYAVFRYGFREDATWAASADGSAHRFPFTRRAVAWCETHRTMVRSASMWALAASATIATVAGGAAMGWVWRRIVQQGWWSVNDKEPYVQHFFCVFTLANSVLLAGLAASAYLLFRRRVLGVHLLAATLVAELYYWAIVNILWYLPTVGMSAAIAKGIGNMGIAPNTLATYPESALAILASLALLRVWDESPTEPAATPLDISSLGACRDGRDGSHTDP